MVLGSSAAIVNVQSEGFCARVLATSGLTRDGTKYMSILTHLGQLWERIRSRLKDTKLEEVMSSEREGQATGVKCQGQRQKKRGAASTLMQHESNTSTAITTTSNNIPNNEVTDRISQKWVSDRQ